MQSGKVICNGETWEVILTGDGPFLSEMEWIELQQNILKPGAFDKIQEALSINCAVYFRGFEVKIIPYTTKSTPKFYRRLKNAY